jgi:hypothetical protein
MRMNLVATAAAALLASVLAGCGGSANGNPDAGNPPSDGACNTVSNAAPLVTHVARSGAVPAMTGGTIENGTYFLTAMELYNGRTTSNDHQETWVVANGVLQAASKSGTSPLVNSTGTLVTSGNQLTINVSCPGTASVTGNSYTATPTQFRVIFFDGPDDVRTYTKQ